MEACCWHTDVWHKVQVEVVRCAIQELRNGGSWWRRKLCYACSGLQKITKSYNSLLLHSQNHISWGWNKNQIKWITKQRRLEHNKVWPMTTSDCINGNIFNVHAVKKSFGTPVNICLVILHPHCFKYFLLYSSTLRSTSELLEPSQLLLPQRSHKNLDSPWKQDKVTGPNRTL